MKRPKRTKKRDLRQVAFTRFMLVVAIFVIWIGGISVRLVNLQVTQHAWLKEKAQDIRQDVKQTRMLRGTIFDRNERALAMSLRVKTLYADPSEIADPDAFAGVVGKALKLDAGKLAANLRQAKEANKRYIPIAKKLDEEIAQKLNRNARHTGAEKGRPSKFRRPPLARRSKTKLSVPNTWGADRWIQQCRGRWKSGDRAIAGRDPPRCHYQKASGT
jgi:cell division protein FtsI/penicillin-binding protein 2